jgi:predicted kinase
MEKQTLFILCGEAFSGKSTLAKELADKYGAKIVGIDRVYFAADPILALESTPDEDDASLWKNLWTIVFQGIKNHLLLGHSVVVDDNCFRLSRRDQLRDLAGAIGVKTVLIYLDTPADVLKERKEKNKASKERHDVPSAWMVEDAVKFERPTADEHPIILKNGMGLSDIEQQLKL